MEQLKERALLAAKLAAQNAQLSLKKAEQEVDRKEKEALLLKQEADEDDLAV